MNYLLNVKGGVKMQHVFSSCLAGLAPASHPVSRDATCCVRSREYEIADQGPQRHKCILTHLFIIMK